MRVATAQGDVEVRASLNDPLIGLTGQNLSNYLGMDSANSWGKPVNAEGAISGTIGVYACVSLLADVIGSLPLHLYRRTSDERRERIATDTASQGLVGTGYPGTLARLLGEMPNPEMTAQEFWETTVGCGALWGNAYAQVIRNQGARPVELWPLRPDKIEVFRVTSAEDGLKLGLRKGEKFYSYLNADGTKTRLNPGEVMHFKWFGTDGLVGLSPIAVGRNLIAGEQAQTDHQGQFYSNQAMPGSIVTIPKRGPNEFGDRAKTYREHLEGLYKSGGRGRIAVVEEGVTWQALQMSMKDMEFIATHKWNIQQLCQLWRIPAYIMDPEKTSSWGTGVEQQFLGMLTMTLRPILERIENTINRDLGLVPGVKTLLDERIYPEFEVEALLRADSATRWASYSIASTLRVLNPSQIAAIENLPFDADRPTDYVNPNTSTPAGSVSGEAPPADIPAPEPAQLQAASSIVEVDYRDEEDAKTDLLLAVVEKMTDVHAADMKTISSVKRAEITGQPEVTVDTQPFADAIRAVVSRFAEMDANQSARMDELIAATKPRQSRREVIRDEKSNIVEIRDIPVEETA